MPSQTQLPWQLRSTGREAPLSVFTPPPSSSVWSDTTTLPRTTTTTTGGVGGGPLSVHRRTRRISSESHRHRDRTPSRLNTPAACESTTLIAVVEGRGLAGEVGIAVFVLGRPTLLLYQFNDTYYSKVIRHLDLHEPTEIIMPDTVCSDKGRPSRLFQVITEGFPNVPIKTVARRHFNERGGLETVKRICVPECFPMMDVELATKYYCLATANALVKYIEYYQAIQFTERSLKVTFSSGDKTLLIDIQTAVNLELVCNARDPKSSEHLLGVLNYTRTKSGRRFLRTNLLQPPSDLATIVLRQDALEELLDMGDGIIALQDALGRFQDLDQLIYRLVSEPKTKTTRTCEQNIESLIKLKSTLELVGPLHSALGDVTSSSLLNAYKATLEDERFVLVLERIESIIASDIRSKRGTLAMRFQKCFAVKMGINGLLDVARRTYSESCVDSEELVQQYGEEYKLPLRHAYASTRGFYISMSIDTETNNDITLPAIFINVQKSKRAYTFTSLSLMKINDRVESSLQEIYVLSSSIIDELVVSIRTDIGSLHELTECVTALDMIASFATVCTLGTDHVRPDFSNDTLAIRKGVHAIISGIDAGSGRSRVDATANDIYASEASNFHIITGPNMSGKSTYLKQIALLQIIAQTGAFVPAQYASFRLADHIFSRLGSDDDLETNSSTFGLEMRDMSYVLGEITDRSLVLIDELGRGTSLYDGLGIAHAICESLLSKKAFCFFATHFKSLRTSLMMYPNIKLWHMKVTRNPTVYTHRLTPGASDTGHYGIDLATTIGLPDTVIKKAEDIVKRLHVESTVTAATHLQRKQSTEQQTYSLAMKLIQVFRNSRLEPSNLRLYLMELKHQYASLLRSIKEK